MAWALASVSSSSSQLGFPMQHWSLKTNVRSVPRHRQHSLDISKLGAAVHRIGEGHWRMVLLLHALHRIATTALGMVPFTYQAGAKITQLGETVQLSMHWRRIRRCRLRGQCAKHRQHSLGFHTAGPIGRGAVQGIGAESEAAD